MTKEERHDFATWALRRGMSDSFNLKNAACVEWIAERDKWRQHNVDFGLTNPDEIAKKVMLLLRQNGFKCELVDPNNKCIHAWSQHGIRYTYYATTGTIQNEKREGLTELLELLREGER